MAMRRSFPTVLSDRLPETRDFYVALLGFEVAFDSDWYVALTRLDGDTRPTSWRSGRSATSWCRPRTAPTPPA